MLEFVIAFPVILVLIFACIQFAHIWIAKMVTHYAAFCAARSALVCKSDEYNNIGQRAALQVCNWMGSGLLQPKTSVTDDSPKNVTAMVTGTFSLITPIVGPMIAWSTSGKNAGNTSPSGFPTLTLTESVTLPKPYVTVVQAGF